MRIAFFGDTAYVGTREWIAWLAACPGVEVHALVLPGAPADVEGVTFHRVSAGGMRGRAAFFACVPSLKRALRRVAPDLLVAYRVVSYGFSASLTGFHPLVLAAQGQFIVSPETPGFFRVFARRAARRADLIHAWAPPMAESLVRLGAAREKILVLPRGVDDDHFSAGEMPPPPLTLVSTRQLERYYNFATLLEAVRLVRREVPEVRYLLAGEGGAREELEAASRRGGLEGAVRFLGAVARAELPSLLRSAHLYVSAVPTDGTSSSLLEAMACGVVPVVTDNAPNRCWIHDGEGGRLVPARDTEGYARAIVTAWKDLEWRREARRVNREKIVASASWKRNMARFLDAYRALVGAGSLEAGRRTATA